jgi:hypothetical protein
MRGVDEVIETKQLVPITVQLAGHANRGTPGTVEINIKTKTAELQLLFVQSLNDLALRLCVGNTSPLSGDGFIQIRHLTSATDHRCWHTSDSIHNSAQIKGRAQILT